MSNHLFQIIKSILLSGLAEYNNKKINIIEQKYYENDYSNFELNELQNQIQKVISEEKPINNAINSENENRSLEELKKIIESRIIDITQ